MGDQWFPQANFFFLATPARTRNQRTHQQSLSLLALHTNTQFRVQVCSNRLRKAEQTNATPKNMSRSDVEAKQTGRSAKGARAFAQEFKPMVATLGRNLFKYLDAAKCQESKLEPGKILKARSVGAGLHRMNSLFSFKSSVVQ